MVNLVGPRVAALRRERGWSQERLARSAGCHKNTILHLEKTGRVSLETLGGVARALGVDQSVLVARAPRRAGPEGVSAKRVG
jgi:transcriptional regulator with XRE-family HTH domain